MCDEMTKLTTHVRSLSARRVAECKRDAQHEIERAEVPIGRQTQSGPEETLKEMKN